MSEEQFLHPGRRFVKPVFIRMPVTALTGTTLGGTSEISFQSGKFGSVQHAPVEWPKKQPGFGDSSGVRSGSDPR